MADRVQDLKARIDVAALISETVQLKKEGETLRGLCPLHPDQKTPSLVVYPKTQRWKCFGCDRKGDVVQWHMELNHVDFKTACFALEERFGSNGHKQPEAIKETVYDIVDHHGDLVAQHVRRELGDGKKTFIWRRNGENTLGKLKLEDVPLYNMRGLIEATPGSPVIITEGEKACDALVRLGYLALGTVTGASECPSVKTLEPLVGSERVYLWPDADPAGFAHMGAVANHLRKLEIAPYLVRWADSPAKGDAHDFCALHSKDDLEALLSGAEPWPTEAPKSEMKVLDDSIEQSVPLLSENVLQLRAGDVRRERTGVHARLSVLLDGQMLAWDVFNIERDGDRQRLAKSAADRLGDLERLCGWEFIKKHLDAFASGVWQLEVGRSLGEFVSGSSVISAPSFVLKPYVIKGGGTILYAPQGRGKSYTAIAMGVSVDAGINKFWPVTQARVLFVNLERSRESIQQRLATVNLALGLPQTRRLLMMNARGRGLNDVAEAIKRTVREHNVGLVIVDSISRMGFGDLKDDVTANKTIDNLNAICPTWLAIGHCARGDESHVFGSVHFEAGADIIVELSSQVKGTTTGIGLQITKANDIAKGDMRCYALEFCETGLSGIRGAKQSEFGELAVNKKTSLTDLVRDYLLDVGKASAPDIADALGRNRANVSDLLNHSDDFVRIGREGKTVLWGMKE